MRLHCPPAFEKLIGTANSAQFPFGGGRLRAARNVFATQLATESVPISLLMMLAAQTEPFEPTLTFSVTFPFRSPFCAESLVVAAMRLLRLVRDHPSSSCVVDPVQVLMVQGSYVIAILMGPESGTGSSGGGGGGMFMSSWESGAAS